MTKSEVHSHTKYYAHLSADTYTKPHKVKKFDEPRPTLVECGSYSKFRKAIREWYKKRKEHDTQTNT